MGIRKFPIRIGFIWVWLAARSILKNLQSHAGFEIVWHIRKNKHLGQVNGFGAIFDNLNEFILLWNIDYFFICTPPNERYLYESFLLKKWISYFVEKPPLIDNPCSLQDLLDKATNKTVIWFHWREMLFDWKGMHIPYWTKLIICKRRIFNPFSVNNWPMPTFLDRMSHQIDFCLRNLDGPLLSATHKNYWNILRANDELVLQIWNVKCIFNYEETNDIENDYMSIDLIWSDVRYFFDYNTDFRFQMSMWDIIILEDWLSRQRIINKFIYDSDYWIIDYKKTLSNFIKVYSELKII